MTVTSRREHAAPCASVTGTLLHHTEKHRAPAIDLGLPCLDRPGCLVRTRAREEVIAVFVEGHRHDAVAEVESLLNAISMVHVNVHIQHPASMGSWAGSQALVHLQWQSALTVALRADSHLSQSVWNPQDPCRTVDAPSATPRLPTPGRLRSRSHWPAGTTHWLVTRSTLAKHAVGSERSAKVCLTSSVAGDASSAKVAV